MDETKTNQFQDLGRKVNPMLPAVFPFDDNGVQVKLGDKVKGFGFLTCQGNFQIDLSPIVTANIQNNRLYFGNLSAESFRGGFIIIK